MKLRLHHLERCGSLCQGMIISAKKQTSSLKSSFKLIKKEIEAVEKILGKLTDDFDPGVAPYVSYVCETEGKRIRPALAFLVGGAVAEVNEKHVNLGAILELIHIASLVHDDIIDGAAERRQVPTANAKWGEGIAVLLGDALFSHAMKLSTDFDDLFLSRRISEAARDVCQGEILQTQRRFDLTMTKRDYFKLIEMKTGALFGAATGLSAYISGSNDEEVQSMTQFGLDIGTAYQIYDDCLDMVGTEQQFGKTLGTDLEKGKLTLPLLYLLEDASEHKRDRLQKRILNQEPLDLPVLVGIADYEGSITRSLDYAINLVKDCSAQAKCLPNERYGSALVSVCDYMNGLFTDLRNR